MKITIEQKGNIALLTLEGHLGADRGEDLAHTLSNHIEKGNHKIIINMNGVSSVNSQGLSVLISSQKKARVAGGEIKLAGLNRYIKEFFELTHLRTEFEIYETNENAFDSFSAKP